MKPFNQLWIYEVFKSYQQCYVSKLESIKLRDFLYSYFLDIGSYQVSKLKDGRGLYAY